MSEESPTRDELLAENRRLRTALSQEQEAPAESARADVPGLFREAFHLGPAAQAVTRLADGTFVEVNEQFSRLAGYERDELIGRSSLDLWMSGRLRRIALGRLQTHGEILDVEFRVRTKSGEARWVLGSCRRVAIDGDDCMLVSCVDVTERRRMEASWQESEELFRRIFHLSPTALCLSNLAESHFTDVNPEMCRLTGYEREELMGHSSLELGLWDDPAQRSEAVERLRAEGGVLHDYEMRLRTKTGEIREVLASFQLLQTGGEETMLSVLSDISARKRTEESLREAKRDADRAREEAEDLAQFRSSVIANMTHEVRTPLTVILGFTTILRQGVDRSHHRFVDLIERSGRRLLMTLDSVLDLAQLESGTIEVNARPHNILDVVDSVANATRSFAEEKGLRFETELPDEALYAEVDDELFSRALGHLVDNAIKFTDEGGVTLRVRSEDGRVLVAVEDTGIGIDEAFVSQLFDTFSQESSGMERNYQGSGMGLAVAARLVDHFDGEVRVESEKGTGSTFTVALPKAESMPADWKNRAQVA